MTQLGAGSFERIADESGDAQDDLVARLAPRSGECWLDVATGTGAVAMRAARAGADVTGIDFALPMIETAKRLAADERLSIDYRVGDAERVPYPDASFDVVSSSFGVVFAPDQRCAAAELARVCSRGGRLGLLCWRPEGAMGGYQRLLASFQPPPLEGAGSPLDWGRDDYVRQLLGHAFELEFTDGLSVHDAASSDELWELFVTAHGPLKTLVESLGPERRAQLQEDVLSYFEAFRADGIIRWKREYVAVLGTRRG
jgi:ubiquinone/menaquinone biosynthesis C-methylase UbiE